MFILRSNKSAQKSHKCLRSYKSIQDYSTELHSMELRSVELCSNPNFHSCNTLFWLKKWLKRVLQE